MWRTQAEVGISLLPDYSSQYLKAPGKLLENCHHLSCLIVDPVYDNSDILGKMYMLGQ